jgi:DNA polymerase III sliding clamp (beta) subunit (PCNA family)
MKFNVNQQDLQQALNYCQGVIEKRSTLPILSNILLDARIQINNNSYRFRFNIYSSNK